jgi:hypothetical protein
MGQFRGQVQDLMEDCSDPAKSHGLWTLTRDFPGDYWKVWRDTRRLQGLRAVNFVEFRKDSLLRCPISDLRDRGWVGETGFEPTIFNLSETSCTEDEEDKGDRAQRCSPYLAPC